MNNELSILNDDELSHFLSACLRGNLGRDSWRRMAEEVVNEYKIRIWSKENEIETRICPETSRHT